MIYRPPPIAARKAAAVKARVIKDILAGLKFEHTLFTKQDAVRTRILQLESQKQALQLALQKHCN